jgi:hypothetical protein
MATENSKHADLKQKAIHEGQEFAGIFLYLAFFFCAVVTNQRLLLNDGQISYFSYGAALINAAVIAKVILIGEYARLGRRQETRPLLLVAIYKAFLFSLLVLAFHIVEELIKLIVHGENISAALHHLRMDLLLSHCVVVFCTFIPLFAFRELQRVLGEESFRGLFFRTGAISKSDVGGVTDFSVRSTSVPVPIVKPQVNPTKDKSTGEI